MNIKRTLLAFTCTLAFAAAAGAQTASTLQDAASADAKQAATSYSVPLSACCLQGAWQATLTPEEGGPPPFLALFNFTSEGGVVETDAGPPNPLQFSPGHGEWRKVGRGNIFNITYTQLEFDASQNNTGIFRARMTVKLNRQQTEFTGRVTVEFMDLAGNVLFSGNGTVKGRRLPVLGAD